MYSRRVLTWSERNNRQTGDTLPLRRRAGASHWASRSVTATISTLGITTRETHSFFQTALASLRSCARAFPPRAPLWSNAAPLPPRLHSWRLDVLRRGLPHAASTPSVCKAGFGQSVHEQLRGRGRISRRDTGVGGPAGGGRSAPQSNRGGAWARLLGLDRDCRRGGKLVDLGRHSIHGDLDWQRQRRPGDDPTDHRDPAPVKLAVRHPGRVRFTTSLGPSPSRDDEPALVQCQLEQQSHLDEPDGTSRDGFFMRIRLYTR